jgi:mono/diheme cytochrome c family protein
LQHRVVLRGWDWLFFDEGAYTPDPHKSAEWNRGAYLVQGAGHCGACHTPKNALGGDKSGKALQGGQIQNWFAPKLAEISATVWAPGRSRTSSNTSRPAVTSSAAPPA